MELCSVGGLLARVCRSSDRSATHSRLNDKVKVIEALLNKVGQLLSSSIIVGIVEQPCAKPDLRDIMDEGKILIVNLSKGRVGEDNAALLGAFFVNGMQQAAMSRADIAEPDRRDFSPASVINEWMCFQHDSSAGHRPKVGREAGCYAPSDSSHRPRSYRLATQYLKQMERDGNAVICNIATRDAVFGNVGSIISFQVGPNDCEDLARQLNKYEDQVTSTDLTSLPKYRAYVRLLIDGIPSRPFTMKTLPPPRCDDDRSTKIRNVSRRRYGVQATNN